MSPDTPPFCYNPTPLGDFDDTDDTNITTFYTDNAAGDGSRKGVREEYISNLLQQRRFSSVLCNPHLNHQNVEFYFHLGFDSASPILARFNRIKWVLIVRSKSDVELVARRILEEFPQFAEEKDDGQLPQPVGSTDRFYMIQMASIVIVSCGIGASSISILLQEVELYDCVLIGCEVVQCNMITFLCKCNEISRSLNRSNTDIIWVSFCNVKEFLMVHS